MYVLNGALLPMEVHLKKITHTLKQTLDTPIIIQRVYKKKPASFASRTYWWKTDIESKEAHEQRPFKYVQLQIEFVPDYRYIVIDFLCIPESCQGQGKGRQIVNQIFGICWILGYLSIYIESQEKSLPFWLKVGFESLEPGSSRFPRAMVYHFITV